jgi:DNA-directed RNA polymerase specialized sigma24 family protein
MTAENDLFSETLQIIATHYCEQAKRTTSLAWLASPRGCLFRIVQRDCRDTHRRELKKRTLTLPFDDRLAAQTEVPDEQISSEEHSFRRERLALIDQFISGLNDRDRRILQAKISRTPCRQLAAALNENEGRLRTQACRLWARLKRHIQIRTAAIKRAA